MADPELRMAENIDIFDFTLTGEEMKQLTGLNTRVGTGGSPDKFFLVTERSSV